MNEARRKHLTRLKAAGQAVVALAEQAEQATDQTDREAALYELVDAVHALNRAYAALGLAAWGEAGLKLTHQSLSDVNLGNFGSIRSDATPT